ncbi:MAG: diguanylate cyclase domain-containing protein, partial [Solirubrobacterales bacterium]
MESAASTPASIASTPASTRERVEREALLRVAARVAGSNDLEQVLRLSATDALDALGASSLAISRFETDPNGEPICRTLINVGELSPAEEAYPTNETYAVARYPSLKRMLDSGEPYFDSLDDPNCESETARTLRELGKASDLGVPIEIEGKIWGELWAAAEHSMSPFEARDVSFLEAIAGQLAVAIGRAELFSNVSRMAYEDSLTGLANRRAFNERLSRACERFLSEGVGVVVVLCDVDALKQVNDAGGHVAGDEVLVAVAEALVSAAAQLPGALVARLAGDEFCVLAEKCSSEEMERVAASAQELIAQAGTPTSISCGIAATDHETDSPAGLLRAADTAQYVSKRRGGNRIHTHGSHTEEHERVVELPATEDGGESPRGWAAIEGINARLEDELADAPTLDRLELVASTFTELADLARWSISIVAPGTGFIRDLSVGENRQYRGSRVRAVGSFAALQSYELSGYPQTAEAMDRSGTFTVNVDDPDADRAEAELLVTQGHRALLAASATNHEGSYLLELVSDRSEPFEDGLEAAVGLAMRAAVVFSPQALEVSRNGGTHARTLGLSLALADRLGKATSAEAACEAVVEEVCEAFQCDFVHLIGVVEERLELRAERAVDPAPENWSQRAEAGLIGRALRKGSPVIAGDVHREPQYRGHNERRQVLSELVVPVWTEGELWGALNLEHGERDYFGPEDAKLLEAIASQLGGRLAALKLYESLDRAYMQTAEALSAALEATDSYTAAHSRAIVERSVAVGERLGLEPAELRVLRYGAALHDIGKIAIPHEILNKPGPLTEDERAVIERHTLIGERILEPIEFLDDIRPVVRSAHERWDGKGYPDGLAGERIPLGARILFACDAYDAMTTDRVYREALRPEQARREL